MLVRIHRVPFGIPFVIGVAVAVLTIPFFVHSQSTEELQKQIINLLERLDSLQTQLDQSGNQTNVPIPTYEEQVGAQAGDLLTGSGVLSGGLMLPRELERGDRGKDVSSLQAFIARDRAIYPTGQITGFFGPLTEDAVKKFQVACGIVTSGDYRSTGYGRVGPKTKTAFMVGCQGIPQGVVGGFMRVSPTFGNAPLVTTIAVTANTSRSCEYGSYTLDFGDRTATAQIIVPAGRCAEFDQSIPHTYTQPGTYTLALRAGTHYATTRVVVSGDGAGNIPTTVPGTTVLPSFSYRGKTFSLGSQEILGPLELYEYPLIGQPIEQWMEMLTFGRDKTLGGRATLNDLDGAAEQTLNTMRENGAVIYKTFTHQNRRDPSKIYNVIIMAFQIPGYVELDIRKMFIHNGEIISITHGQKTALQGSVSAQQIINSFFAQSDIDGLVFVENNFYLPWLVTYTTPQTNVNPQPITINPQLSLTPGYENDIRKLQVRFTLTNSCAGFTLNWGDNSAPFSRAQSTTNCSAGVDEQIHVHVYPASNATYVINLTYGPPGNQSSQTASYGVTGY